MNNWDIRKTAIVEADDFQDRYDRSGLNFLFYWKSRYPKFKITLFTIPEKTSSELLKLVHRNADWIEVVVHGFNHESNFECYGWDYEKTKTLMNRTARMGIIFPDIHPDFRIYKNIFKSPGWSIIPGGNGYPSAPEDSITQDPQAVYKALRDMGFTIFDRHYNKSARPEGCKIVCVDCNPDIVHMHTWNMMTPNKDERNGFEQVEERGVPWDQNTEFYFASEAWERGLFRECHD